MQRPSTPPLTAANSIPPKTIKELDEERAARRADEKHKNNAFASSRSKTIVYVVTVQWCGYCTQLKHSIFMGMGMTQNDESLYKILKKRKNLSAGVDERKTLLSEFSNLLLQRGMLTLYEDNNVVIKLLDAETEAKQIQSIVSLLRPSAFPTYYAVYADSKVETFNTAPPNNNSRSYSDWLDDIIGSAHMLSY